MIGMNFKLDFSFKVIIFASTLKQKLETFTVLILSNSINKQFIKI